MGAMKINSYSFLFVFSLLCIISWQALGQAAPGAAPAQAPFCPTKPNPWQKVQELLTNPKISYEEQSAMLLKMDNPYAYFETIFHGPRLPPNNNITSPNAISKDVKPIKPGSTTWVRVYRPPWDVKPQSLPIVVYAHGGGFWAFNADTIFMDDFCARIANKLGSIVVSVDYRLTKFARLPAAYDDYIDALYWIKDSTDEWVRKYADLTDIILMGDSAGGNIAYNAALNISTKMADLEPLQINAVVMVQPFFGGMARTQTELLYKDTEKLPLWSNDLLWHAALPLGVNRDHYFCNPLVNGGSSQLEAIKMMGWRFLVLGCTADSLYDRQLELAKMLDQRGMDVYPYFIKDGYHGIFGSPVLLNVTNPMFKFFVETLWNFAK